MEATYAFANPAIAIGMLVVCTIAFYVIGVYSKNLTKTADDLFVGHKNVGGFVNGFVTNAMYVSLSMFLGGCALIMKLKGAIMYMWLHWIGTVPLMLSVFGICLYRLKIPSPIQFVRMRFGENAGIIAAVVMFSSLIMYALGQFIGMAKLFEVLFSWQYLPGLLLSGVIIIGYITIGGQIGATYNAFIQNALLMLALYFPVVLIFKALGSVSGAIFPWFSYQDMVPAMLNRFPTFFDMVATPRAFLGIIVSIFMGEMCLLHLVVRTFSAPSIRAARSISPWFILSMGFTATLVFSFSFIAVYHFEKSGMVLAAKDLDKLVPWLTLIYTNEWVAGFVVAGAVAAAISSLNGQLLGTGLIMTNDIIGRIKKTLKDKTNVKIGYITVALSGILCMVLAIDPPHFLTISIMWGITFIGTACAPLIMLGCWSKRINSKGALIASLVGPISFIIVSPHFFKSICIGSGLWAALGFSGGMFSVPLSFICAIVFSLIAERMPAYQKALSVERESTDKLVETMHGWRSVSEKRYASTGWLYVVVLLCVGCIVWSLMPGPWLITK